MSLLAARRAAEDELARWGGKLEDEAATWDAIVTVWAYFWLRNSADVTAHLSTRVEESAVMSREATDASSA